jgi:thiol-disulfide isomerase/thioredoxin
MSKSDTSSTDISRWSKYSSLLLNATLLIVAFLGISAFQARNMLDTDRVVAPVLQAQTLAGDYFDLSTVEARPTLIYFFAPWCHYCAFSSDNLVRLRRLRDEENLRIITVALDWQSVAEVRDYADKHELNVPVLIGDANTERDWKVYGFPTYYVLDSKNRVAKRDIGYSTQLGLWWRTWIVD